MNTIPLRYAAEAQHLDLVLRNAFLIDPSQGIWGHGDIGICDRRIAALGASIPRGIAARERDLGGKYLSPGLIDLHGHWYGGSAYGIDPNICLNHGVTTVVDAGTTGFINFGQFRKTAIDSARIGVFAFLNVAALGIPTPFVGELEDHRYVRPLETQAVLAEHADVLVGIKIRQGTMTGTNGIPSLQHALSIAQNGAAPVMVHIGKGAHTPEILRMLRAGDVITHCFQGRGDGIIAGGSLLPEALQARKEGVLFDVGHGAGSFHWETAKRAFEYHFYPDIISTDLHRYSIERWAVDMPTTMSKFLHLGMSLQDVILKSTWMPAKAIHREDEIGTLKLGAHADLFAFDLSEGYFDFEDTHLHVERATRMIRPLFTVKDGELIQPGEYPTNLRKYYQYDYDVLKYIEESA